MKTEYLLKQAMSPGSATLLSAGIGGGIGYLIDKWRQASGTPTENKWIGPTLMAIIASTPAVAYGVARNSYDVGSDGKHSLPFLKRWFSNDNDFWTSSSNAIPNFHATLQEYWRNTSDERQLRRAGKSVKSGEYVTHISPIPVNAFNQEIWVDASRGRTPMEAAGFVTDTLNQTSRRTGSSFVSPGQVIDTMVNAGIGYGTAWLAGKTLGALAGVSPATQNKLQEIGTWGGLISGIANSAR